MSSKIVWFIVGVIFGGIGSAAYYSRSDTVNQTPVDHTDATLTIADTEIASQPLSEDPETARRESPVELNPVELNAVSESDGEVPESRIPYIYNDVIGEPKPKRLMTADRHAAFLLEPRDQSWASAMESGIANYLADNAAELQFKVEFVECRSEHCEVAGYIPPGIEDDSRQLKSGLKNSAWWQGGLSSASTRRTFDGVTRVVIIFNRNGAWTR